MSTPQEHTKGPWAWQRFGSEWCLTGQWGMRPIVLAASAQGVTSLVGGLLVPLDPEHPDARLIVAAPDLLDACEALAEVCAEDIPYPGATDEEQTATGLYITAYRDALAAIAKART